MREPAARLCCLHRLVELRRVRRGSALRPVPRARALGQGQEGEQTGQLRGLGVPQQSVQEERYRSALGEHV